MKNEFKVDPNLAVGVFTTALYGVMVYYFFLYTQGSFPLQSIIVYAVFLVLYTFFFFGCRPYKYVFKDKILISKKRLWKDKEVDLMRMELVTDPVPRLADLVTRPHAIEIYSDAKKLYKYFPKRVDRADFTAAVMRANKRIHCTVQAYTDIHRSIEKRERKARKRAEREAYRNMDSASENGNSRRRR